MCVVPLSGETAATEVRVVDMEKEAPPSPGIQHTVTSSLSSWLHSIKNDDIDGGLAADFDGSLSGLGEELGSSTYNMRYVGHVSHGCCASQILLLSLAGSCGTFHTPSSHAINHLSAFCEVRGR